MQNIGNFAKIKYTPDMKEILTRDFKSDHIYNYSPFQSFSPICIKSQKLIKLPLRSILCKPECSRCIYSSDFLNEGKNEKYKCNYEQRQCTFDQLYVDFRLGNLLTHIVQVLKDSGKPQSLLQKAKISMTTEKRLIVTLEKQIFLERTNDGSTGGKICTQNQQEARVEVQSTIRKRAYEYMENKNKLGQLTRNLEKQTNDIIQSIRENQNGALFDQIIKKASPSREIENNISHTRGCLFGFIDGMLFCGFRETPVRQYTISHQDQNNKKALTTFYGGSWFFADVGHPKIFVVGGSSTYSAQKVGKNIMQFKLDPIRKQAEWNPKIMPADMPALDLFHPGVIYVDKLKTAWVIGGLVKKMNKATATASKSIMILNLEKKQLTPSAVSLKQPRFNQSYTYSKNKIYIFGGLPLKNWDYQINLEDNIKTIKETASVGHYNPLRLEIFNINNKSIQAYQINIDNARIQSYMYRCMCTIIPAPSKDSDIFVVFGGNPDVLGQGQHALALDLKPVQKGVGEKVFGRDFGDQMFKREIFVGSKFPIAKHTNGGVNNIVDLQGIKSENFTEWLSITYEQKQLKIQQFALTSQQSDFGYRWRF